MEIESTELTESSESASGNDGVPAVESIADATAKNIALISAERAAAIVGAPRMLLFVAILDDGLKTATVTRDFPLGDFPAVLENLRTNLVKLTNENAEKQAGQMSERVKEIESVPALTPEG